MNPLGIYFGTKVISIVETKGRKLINSTQIVQSTISTAGELEERAPQDVKLIEIIAFFKNELRKKKIQSKEATLSLSGRDLIIRTFEIPVMPRDELQGAITFEVKKYIPFKAEELFSDYQVEFDNKSKTNLILFMGIKKETLEKYISIFNQLDIRLRGIEYSAFSLLRCLKLRHFPDKGVIAVLGADISDGDEVNFTVLNNNFPLFSRDIYPGVGLERIAAAGMQESEALLEKLKSEIRISLDYYDRRFPAKNIKKLFLISNQDYVSGLKDFIKELGLSVQVEDYSEYIGKPVSGSLSFIKAYSSSLSRVIKTRVRVNLLGAKEKAGPLKEKTLQAGALALLKGIKFNRGILALCLLICVAPYIIGTYRKQALREGLNSIVAKRARVATVNPEASYEELTNTGSEYKKKLDTLAELTGRQLYISELLNIIPAAIPEGAWLTKLVLTKQDKDEAGLSLTGIVFLSDSDKEIETANRFLSNLKETPGFTKYFKEISIASLNRRQLDNVTATDFVISCKTKP